MDLDDAAIQLRWVTDELLSCHERLPLLRSRPAFAREHARHVERIAGLRTRLLGLTNRVLELTEPKETA